MVRGYLQIGGNLIQKNTNQMMNNVNVHQTDIEIAFEEFCKTYLELLLTNSSKSKIEKLLLANLPKAIFQPFAEFFKK